MLHAQVVKPQIFRVPLAPIVCSCAIFGGVYLIADTEFQPVPESFMANPFIMPLHSL